MTVLSFPNIKPQFLKTIKTPDYSLVTKQFDSGFENTIRKSYQGYSTELALEYQHINQEQVVSIINFYNSVKGSAIAFKLPVDFFSIPDAVTNSIADLGSTERWKFANEPTLTLLVATPSRGVYSWQIQLKAVYPESNGIDGETVVTGGELITVVAAAIITPIFETPVTQENIIVTPIADVTNPVKTLDTTVSFTRLVRASKRLTTTPITAGSGLKTSLEIVNSFICLQVKTDISARIRIYTNSAYQNNDLNRVSTIDPTGDHGVLLEIITDVTYLTVNLSPIVCISCNPGTNIIPITINNLLISASIINVDFLILPLEIL